MLESKTSLPILFKDFSYLFLESGEEREKNINVWLLLMCPLLGTWPTTQACALTWEWTSDPLLCGPALNPLTPARASFEDFLKITPYFFLVLLWFHFSFLNLCSIWNLILCKLWGSVSSCAKAFIELSIITALLWNASPPHLKIF